jgi:hypothetical protein
MHPGHGRPYWSRKDFKSTLGNLIVGALQATSRSPPPVIVDKHNLSASMITTLGDSEGGDLDAPWSWSALLVKERFQKHLGKPDCRSTPNDQPFTTSGDCRQAQQLLKRIYDYNPWRWTRRWKLPMKTMQLTSKSRRIWYQRAAPPMLEIIVLQQRQCQGTSLVEDDGANARESSGRQLHA